ncbi:hypothetical protein ACWD7F_14090 [Streptomyces sp. NPDC005122]
MSPIAGTTPLALYSRSRGIPATLAVLVGTALLTLWVASLPGTFLAPFRGAPLLAFAPLPASAAIGASLHPHAPELDRTAVRPWWPRRLAHLLVLTALAATALALAAPGDVHAFGPVGTVLNTLGAVGVAALGAVLFDARAAWMPTMLYFSAMYLSAASPRMREATVLAWPLRTGPQLGAWAAALALFVLGAGLYAVRGARPEGPRG